uniref:CUE domain-containing protein n=1 Tax=Haemonchus contortus TaxID=6289 RepID=A0A7I4YAR0_HAECO
MKLEQARVVATTCPPISRIAYNVSKTDLTAWQDVANTLAFTFERILQLPSESFWSTVVFDSNIMTAFDQALEALPGQFELDEYQLIFGWDPSISKAATRLYYSTFALFLRTAVFNEKTDTQLSKKEYTEIIRGRGIFPSKRLACAISFFSEYNEIAVELTKKQSQLDPRVSSELRQICAELGKSVAVLAKNARQLLDEFYKRDGEAKVDIAHLIDEWFCTSMVLCREGCTLVDVLSQAGLLKEMGPYVEEIPAFVEQVAQLFPTEAIFDVAMMLSDYPLKRLLRLRTQLYQSAVDFYHIALVRATDDEKIAMIQSALDSEKFIFLLNEKENLSELLKNSPKEFRDYMERALESACDSQKRKIVEELAKCGLLKGLGDLNRLNGAARQAFEEVSQIFPHFSPKYVHLCLRHFGYDALQTIDALLARDEKLPMALRKVEEADLTHKLADEPPTLPVLSFQTDELILSALSKPQDSPSSSSVSSGYPKEPEKKNVFKGLISLAPSKPSATPTTSADVQEKPVNEVMKKLREALNRLKIRVAEGDFDEVEEVGVKGERLVPMANSKTYLSTHKFKVSEADKVAVRPTYEKYRYETKFDDVYDDEYDDGYEQKEFTVEPLNAQTSSDETEGEATDEAEVGGVGKPRGGGRGRQYRNTTRGSTNSAGGTSNNGNKDASGTASNGGENNSRGTSYTGGRQRQMKERHKNAFKQRGADRKMRGAY